MLFRNSIYVVLLAVSSVMGAPTRRQAAQMNLSPEVISRAGGAVPNSGFPPTLSKSTLNDIQVANFLENLESAFFQAAVTNITAWGTAGFPDGTLDIIQRVAAVSGCERAVHPSSTLITHSKNKYMSPPLRTYSHTSTHK